MREHNIKIKRSKKMKKIIALILVLSLSLFCFAACKKDKENNNDNNANNENNTPTEKTYSLAIGVDVAQDAAEVAKTVAVIVTDADGKIVSCRIDCISVTAELKDGEVDASKTYKSKAELKEDYGMLTNNDYYGSKLGEWYQQAQAFETYVIGKTAAEVAAIAVDNDGYPTDSTLTAGCTMGVSEFISAIGKAFASEHKVSFKTSSTFTLGVSACADVTSENGTAEYAADFAGAVVSGGKVIAAIIDSTAATSAISGEDFGAITYPGTKLEQGDKYGMLTNNDYYGSKLGEWYQQAEAFAKFAVGKTAAEVAAIAVDSEGYPTDAALTAGCTMGIAGYKVALEKAITYAR